VPQANQWDDHEVLNNWYPGEILTDARGMLGAEQREWLINGLRRSRATWKGVAQGASRWSTTLAAPRR
jgi:alkaline phosphatase D